MLLTLAGVLLVLWILGFAMNVVGSFIHIVLVLAIIVAVVYFIQGAGRRVA